MGSLYRQCLFLCILAALAGFPESCTGNNPPIHQQTDQSSQFQDRQSIDPGLLAELKAELERALAETGSQKRVAGVPTGKSGRVTDLELGEIVANEYSFSWTYQNPGDYDRSGDVSYEDLWEIALHYGQRTGLDGWADAQHADGDGNGEINFGDVVPIARGFGSVVHGYILQTSATAEDSLGWSFEGSVPLAGTVPPVGNGAPRLSMRIADLPASSYARVVPYLGDPARSSQLGSPSNSVMTAEIGVPQNLTASQGEHHSGIRLSWTAVNGAAGYRIYRDGGGLPIVETGAVTEWLDEVVYNVEEHSYWIRSDYPNGTSHLSASATGYALRRGDWWMLGRDSTHAASSPYIGAQHGRLKWTFETGDEIRSSPAIGGDGTVYVGSDDHKLYAIKHSGSLKWSFTTGDKVRSAPAIAIDGTIYVGSTDDNLYALDRDGTLKWAYAVGANVSSPAISEDSTIYVGSTDATVHAINPDGSLKWSFETESGVWSSPAISADGFVYFGSHDGNLYKVSPDGGLVWKYHTSSRISAAPSISPDGTVYACVRPGMLFAINPDGIREWFFILGSWNAPPAIGVDGRVYTGGYSGRLHVLNPNGTPAGENWPFAASGLRQYTPAVDADGTAYFGTNEEFFAVNSAGSLKWSYPVSSWVSSSPAIGRDGRVYVGSGDGRLYSFGD